MLLHRDRDEKDNITLREFLTSSFQIKQRILVMETIRKQRKGKPVSFRILSNIYCVCNIQHSSSHGYNTMISLIICGSLPSPLHFCPPVCIELCSYYLNSNLFKVMFFILILPRIRSVSK